MRKGFDEPEIAISVDGSTGCVTGGEELRVLFLGIGDEKTTSKGKN